MNVITVVCTGGSGFVIRDVYINSSIVDKGTFINSNKNLYKIEGQFESTRVIRGLKENIYRL